MRRPILLSIVTFCAVAGLASVSGTFAVFTDEAATGENSFSTGEMARVADLKLSPNVNGTCDAYVDDLTTAFYTVTDAQPSPNSISMGQAYCVKNFGSADLTVTFRAFDVSDTETACTGDEEQAGDTSCGTGAGEISSHLILNLPAFPCDGGSAPNNAASLSSLQSTPQSFATIPAGECRSVVPFYTYNPTGSDAQIAQSDQVVFKLAFTGVAP